jgi:SEC-C motif
MLALEALAQLRTTQQLPKILRAELLRLGDEVVDGLIEILEDDDLGRIDSPGKGWPAIHAASLLIELGAERAIEPLIRTLAATELDEILHNEIAVHLHKLGAPVLEPALAALAKMEDADQRAPLIGVLSELGVRDPRVFDAIAMLFQHDLVLASGFAANYGDARFCPHLERAIFAFEPEPDWHWNIQGMADLLEAYEHLGGPNLAAVSEHAALLKSRWEQRQANPIATKIGRNDPCKCGSGKKYKKCCGA